MTSNAPVVIDPEQELFERILDLYDSIYHKDQATVDKITDEADALVLTLKNVNISMMRYGKYESLFSSVFLTLRDRVLRLTEEQIRRGPRLKDRADDDKLGPHLIKCGLDMTNIEVKEEFSGFLREENFKWARFFLENGFQINDPSYNYLLHSCVIGDFYRSNLQFVRTRLLLEYGFDDRIVMNNCTPNGSVSPNGRTALEYLIRLPLELNIQSLDEEVGYTFSSKDVSLAEISKEYFEKYKLVKKDVLKKRGITPTARSESPNHLDFKLEEEQLKIVLKDMKPDPKFDRLYRGGVSKEGKNRCCIS